MSYQFIVLHTKKSIASVTDEIIHFFQTLLKPIQTMQEINRITFIFETSHYKDFESIAQSLSVDLYDELTVFQSFEYPKIDQVIMQLSLYLKMTQKIIFNTTFISYKTMIPYLQNDFYQDLRSFTFNGLEHDFEMLKTIKTYLNFDQNANKTAQRLYLHRNTLSMRIEKFKNVTGFNVKKFTDAHLIFDLL